MNVLVGRRILLVEDVPCIGELLRILVIEAGYEVVGPAPTSVLAIRLASASHLDAALLDVGLGAGFSYPVAEYLQEQDIPFAFMTGYDKEDIPICLQGHPVLGKPMGSQEILDTIEGLIRGRTF